MTSFMNSPLPVIQGLQSQPLDGQWRVRLLCVGASPLHNLGQTKVADLGNVALAQQHVARSQVTMKDLRENCGGLRTGGLTFFEARYSIPRAT